MANSARYNDHFSKMDPTEIYPEIKFAALAPSSSASLMLANMVIDYPTPDEAQVTLLAIETWSGTGGPVTAPSSRPRLPADHPEYSPTTPKDRVWADQFAKDIVAAGAARAKAGRRIG